MQQLVIFINIARRKDNQMEDNFTEETNNFTEEGNIVENKQENGHVTERNNTATSEGTASEEHLNTVSTEIRTQSVNQTTERRYPVSREDSYFDGTCLQLIGWRFLGSLVSLFSFGLCTPWAYTMIYAWEAKHTYIEGRQLHFDGSALQLFGKWILWFLGSIGMLTLFIFIETAIVISFGGNISRPEDFATSPFMGFTVLIVYVVFLLVLFLYGTWIEVSLQKWKISHTHFA